MKAVLDVVRDVVVSELWQRFLYRNIPLKAPRLERVECDDFDEGAERSTSGLFRVLGVVEDLLGENLL